VQLEVCVYHTAISLCLGHLFVTKQLMFFPGVLPKELLRTAAFEQDLQYYLGDSWRDTVTTSKAGDAYCKRIVAAAKVNPSLLIA